MKLTETILRKIIKEQIDDYLEYIPPTKGIPGEDSSSDQSPNRPTRLRFSERLQACVETGKRIRLKVDVIVSERQAGRPNNYSEYTIDGEKRYPQKTFTGNYKTVNMGDGEGTRQQKIYRDSTPAEEYYTTKRILPTKGELFKVLKFVGGSQYFAYTDAEVVGSSSRRTTRSGELSVVMLQHDKFGEFTVALLPNEVRFAK